ncbi:uncharacterized protein [Hetaerina americana]|uniref:uncharacterized protein n=1 Tax=Hetaerina americana TaxID=62018 RepID=UPI003A7F1EA6
MIIREAASGRFTPKILPDNKTSIAKIIKGAQDILQTMSIKLRGSEAIRFMWELGLLKLQRDYKYMLQRLELMPPELSDAFNEQKSSPKITKQQREEGIEHLVAAHCFIEILILLKSQLSIDNESLSLLVLSAVSKITSSVLEFAKSSTAKSPDSSYVDSGLQKVDLSVPLQTKISIPLIKGCNPESWSFKMSTVESDRKTVTIFHKNTDGLFPPEINDKGDKAESEGNSIVKFTSLSCLLYHRG